METLNDQPAGAGPAQPGSGAALARSVGGAALIGYALLLATLSWLLSEGRLGVDAALLWLAGGSMLAGALYLLAATKAQRARAAPPLWLLLAVFIGARLIVGVAPPMLETDFYRYMWDGGVTVAGLNPYMHTPNDAMLAAHEPGDPIGEIARRGESVLERVNHPHLTTIYPPVAQAAFAAAHLIDPFGVAGLRAVFLLADLCTLALLLKLLGVLGLPRSQILWYAWNPLLLREVYSSVHMDILLLPLIALAILAVAAKRRTIGAACCVVASAIKVWPVLLVPVLLRPLAPPLGRLIFAGAACAALALVLWSPVLLVEHASDSGFVAYGKGWQNNDGFFRAGIWATERMLALTGHELWRSHTIMRIVSVSLVASVVAWCSWKSPRGARETARSCLIVVAAVFLLSPTQFPWYWLWLLPLLTLTPFIPLLLYTALLPLYYAQDQIPFVHWIQHAPVWALLAIAWLRRRPGGPRPTKEAEHA
ncbi:MAG: DUF2029 domain-containing protein [Phycisphaerales bacterium]|nr:MAG: DUF2029 domain-containing protein [Phycisphaerales bacterium]